MSDAFRLPSTGELVVPGDALIIDSKHWDNDIDPAAYDDEFCDRFLRGLSNKDYDLPRGSFAVALSVLEGGGNEGVTVYALVGGPRIVRLSGWSLSLAENDCSVEHAKRIR